MVEPSPRLRGAASQGTILLIGDANPRTDEVARTLRECGSEVHTVRDPTSLSMLIEQVTPGVILIDIWLQARDALLLCLEIRSYGSTPIILYGNTRRRWDPALGLRVGADAFVHLPTYPGLLEAQVQAVLRRSPASGLNNVSSERTMAEISGLQLGPNPRAVMLHNRQLALTPTEYRLLRAFALQSGQVIPSSELNRLLWDHGGSAEGNALAAHVARLRSKLADGGWAGPRIEVVRGQGYRLRQATKRAAEA